MSRGLQGKFELLEIKDNAACYAYGGSDFSFPYDKNIYKSCDGRIRIMLTVFYESIDISTALDCKAIELLKPCYYAEENIYGFDIFALKTIHKIISTYSTLGEIPKTGTWVC